MSLCDSACVYNNNMRHLVICGACVSRSPNVTLFLQLCKTLCKTRTDIPHMFFSFSDSVGSNCLHPFSCLSHIFHSLPPFAISHPSLPSPSVSLSDLADNLAMDDFTFQEQLLTPRLATAGVGGVSSPAAPLWRSYLVPALPVTLALLLLCHQWPVRSHAPITSLPLGFNTNSVERDKLFLKFSSSSKEAWMTKTLHFSLSVSARSCFVLFTGCSQQTY